MERAVCRSQFVATLVVPTCESWLEYVPLPPRCLCPILFALFPNSAHYRLPASVILQSLNSSHSNLQLFPPSAVRANFTPTAFSNVVRMKLPPFISPHSSVDTPEKLHDWHFRIIKCQITACTDNSRGGMR